MRMLEWNSQDTKVLRNTIYKSYNPKEYTGNGRKFFWITILLTIISEIGISYAIYKQSSTLALLFIFITGIVFYRYQFILHDCSHSTLVASRVENRLYGSIAGFISGYPFDLYKKNHAQHHLHTGTDKDLELNNFIREGNSQGSREQFIKKFLQSFLFLDALILIKNIVKPNFKKRTKDKVSPKKYQNIIYFIFSVLLQIIFLNLFNYEVSLLYFFEAGILLLISVGSVSFTLNRIRGMCEHSVVESLKNYNYTRSHDHGVLNKILAPLAFNYHLEHHIFPEISSGNYAKINEKLRQIFPDSNWISKGYISTIKNYLLNDI